MSFFVIWLFIYEIHDCFVTLRIMVKMHLNASQSINQPCLPVRESQMVQRVSLALYWTTKFIVALKFFMLNNYVVIDIELPFNDELLLYV